jgi:hypothetical protein
MDKHLIGPAERLVQTVLAHADHLVHNRPGIVVRDPRSPLGVAWAPVTTRLLGGRTIVFKLEKSGRKTIERALGERTATNQVRADDGRIVGDYRPAGLFPEAATWLYAQIAEVWRLDNELCARWASFAFGEEHRDLKTALAAFMLVQDRKGDPVRDGEAVAFFDDDFRAVGEAMVLLRRKDGRDLSPKLLLRVHELLSLSGVAAINRRLGFGRSARRPPLGRWPKVVEKWLRHREENPKLLEGLVKAGYRTTVIALASRVGYKPASPAFFATLRWKQAQAKDGRRVLAIGEALRPVETWAHLDEAGICAAIVTQKPDYKRIVGQLPPKIGLTRAIVAAAIEAGALSDKDLVVLTPTLEELGLLDVQPLRERWARALRLAEDARAANVARNVRGRAVKDALVEAADRAVQAAVAEVQRDLRVYFMVDVSGSMQHAIERAKGHVAKFLHAFSAARLHVAVFNTQGREIEIKHPSALGVEVAFRGIVAGGGTDYGAGVRAIARHRPSPDEDALFFFVGDEEAPPFDAAVRASGIAPVAFGLLKVGGGEANVAVRQTAATLGIPCFPVDERTFEDPYAIPRTIRALVAATPVGPSTIATRKSLVETILATELLKKPAWAA